MTQSGSELKKMGYELAEKFHRTFEDEQQALQYLSQAIESKDLDPVARGDCYLKSAGIYKDRPLKSKENYDIALNLYLKATEVPGLPGWYHPQNQAERFALCPDVYGFNPEWRNEKIAKNMHMQNLQRLSGTDLAMAASDWFKDHLETADVINTKYTEVGLDYLNKAIERPAGAVWDSVTYTFYGRAYKFHSEKTPENFKNAVTWFEKSIELNANAKNSNQPWAIIGKGTARAYFELAELLSDPTRFGFDQSLRDEDAGKETYHEGIEHISTYGALGPYGILENMFVNVFKKILCFGRTNEDLPTIKQLCQKGRDLANDKNAALYLFEAVSEHVAGDKSIETYKNIVEGYHKSLKAKMELKGSDWIAEEATRWSTPLVLSPGSEDFPPEAQNQDCTRKLHDFLKEIAENAPNQFFNKKVKDILDVSFKIYTVKATKSDPVMRERIKNLINFAVNAQKLSQGSKTAEEEIQKLEKVQLKLQNIQGDEQLYGYYDGVMSTLSQAFTTAQVVSSGQVALDVGPSKSAAVGLKIVSYIPFIGDKLADPLTSIIEYINGGEMISEANNICRLSPSQTEFCTLVQDAVIEAMNNRQTDISDYKEPSPGQQAWYQKITGLIEKLDLKITSTVYGQRYRSLTQKLGNKHASSVLANFIGNGEIYGEKSFLLPDKAKESLVIKLTGIWVEKEEEIPEPTTAATVQNQTLFRRFLSLFCQE